MRERYLSELSKVYPTPDSITTEIINLKSILNLPKTTEHFITDIHGEYEAFNHLLRTASGIIDMKIDKTFKNSLLKKEKKRLSSLIFYPEETLKFSKLKDEDKEEWLRVTIYRLIKVFKAIASKYTRSKVRKALPENFSYILDEMLNVDNDEVNKEVYFQEIISTLIEFRRAEQFIVVISNLIQRLAVDKLHIIGDIYDRGPAPHLIMDRLMKHHDCDIQWGNHDISWLGASLGQPALMANCVRLSLRHGNLEFLENAYGINLMSLVNLAQQDYSSDLCEIFYPLITQTEYYEDKDKKLIAKMHKAISIIQFKLENQLVKENPSLGLETEERYIENINPEKGTVKIDGKEYKLKTNNFPTIDWKDPTKLTSREEEVVKRLKHYFTHSEKLRAHMNYLVRNGAMYLKYNNSLLFHGCVPIDENEDFVKLRVCGKEYSGKALFDKFDRLVRKALITGENLDWLWYLWKGKFSPLYGKYKMTTFEKYFIADKKAHKEEKNRYFYLREKEDGVQKVLDEFDVQSKEGRVINGHTPIREKEGENPIKANGKLIVVDGGLSKHYRERTGISGYTLFHDSYGLRLALLKPFSSVAESISEGEEIVSSLRLVQKTSRKYVKDTDIGKQISEKIQVLRELLDYVETKSKNF